jgi:hypothetical protein
LTSWLLPPLRSWSTTDLPSGVTSSTRRSLLYVCAIATVTSAVAISRDLWLDAGTTIALDA